MITLYIVRCTNLLVKAFGCPTQLTISTHWVDTLIMIVIVTMITLHTGSNNCSFVASATVRAPVYYNGSLSISLTTAGARTFANPCKCTS